MEKRITSEFLTDHGFIENNWNGDKFYELNGYAVNELNGFWRTCSKVGNVYIISSLVSAISTIAELKKHYFLTTDQKFPELHQEFMTSRAI